jgi:KUP system potassium uptake protein
VLSAVEGLSVATPHLEHYVVPITWASWWAVHDPEARHRAGRAFLRAGHGAVVRGAGGARRGSIVQTPEVLRAVDPRYAIALPRPAPRGLHPARRGVPGPDRRRGLYADMGHFGPGRCGWPGTAWCGRR